MCMIDGYKVLKCHTKRNGDGSATSTGLVNGEMIEITYTGKAISEMGATDGKPWLRQVRRDLVKKYQSQSTGIATRKIISFADRIKQKLPKVNKEFIEQLEKHGVQVTPTHLVFCGKLIPLKSNGSYITQIECVELLAKAEENYIAMCETQVENFFK